MGYRSEVVLVVGAEVMPQFMVTMAKSSEARTLCFGDAKVVKNYQETGSILFQWDYIKWYEGYEPIDALTDFMDWCDAEYGVEGSAEHFRFVRVGEEASDFVCRGFGFADVSVERSISW